MRRADSERSLIPRPSKPVTQAHSLCLSFPGPRFLILSTTLNAILQTLPSDPEGIRTRSRVTCLMPGKKRGSL